MITIIVNGAFGKMGATTCEAINQSEKHQLIGSLGRNDSLETCLETVMPEIVIDFTNAHCVYENTKFLINHGVKSVIGASGLTSEQVDELSALALRNQTGCIIAPNFSLGAILMMQFSSLAAAYFSEVEIVETHHQQKLDSPSGTAVKTAKLIEQARSRQKNTCASEELFQGARGALVSDVSIHSLRLPGYIASQQVMFGGLGENLTITHNSISRECFMPGVLLACDKVMSLDNLVYGLENLLMP